MVCAAPGAIADAENLSDHGKRRLGHIDIGCGPETITASVPFSAPPTPPRHRRIDLRDIVRLEIAAVRAAIVRARGRQIDKAVDLLPPLTRLR